MSLNKEVIKSAVNKHYTDFAGRIKSELERKLSNHSDMKAYSSDYDRIQNAKNIYSQINNPSEV